MVQTLKQQWFGNIRGDVLSGIVVALALIPEAIAFSIIAGVDPMVGLYASVCIAVVTAFLGGRPAMISAATGAMALVMAPLMRSHGLDYILAAAVLTGMIQIIFGWAGIAKLMKFIPRAVMIGFVNALAILIFMAQLPQLIGMNAMTYLFVAMTLAIIYLLPRFFTAIPAPLVAIIALSAVAIYGGVNVNTVGDLGTIQQSLPTFFIPNVPLTLETLLVILPYAIAMALVGLLESLLTATIVDDMTDTVSDKARESRGQGIANIVSGFFGGMAGCAMIGQSVINVKSGGRGRLSTLTAGLFLLFLMMALGELAMQIPMPVLVGIMVMVSIGTFDWSSFRYIRKAPRADAIVMLVTVVIVVMTHDLSKGVIAGVVLSKILFVAKIARVRVQQVTDHHYVVNGPLFFASTESFIKAFNLNVTGQNVVIDFSGAHVWDDSAVGAIDQVILKYRQANNEVQLIHLNEASESIVARLAVHRNVTIE